MSAVVVHTDHLVYLSGFLSGPEAAALVDILECTPVVPTTCHDATQAIAFAAPVADGAIGEGRREAAAGWPVWDGTGPAQGAPLPAPLDNLGRKVGRALADLADSALGDPTTDLSFSSVYVDRYPPGGSFFPHTDRACYGPVVAGVSVGPASSRLVVRVDGHVRAETTLEPGSLYAFAGSLRAEPCTHKVVDVTALRFGITYRTPAAGHRTVR